MTDLNIPAPLWRRFAASIYDGLLLMGLCMATLLLSLPFQHRFHLPAASPWLRLAVFVVWLGFFAWFWTRGGQTLGMRAWRLQMRRHDGLPLRLPIALARYVGLLIWWGLVLTPLVVGGIARVPSLATSLPNAGLVAALAAASVLVSLALQRFDPARRLPQDWLAGTEVIQRSQNPSPPTTKVTRAS